MARASFASLCCFSYSVSQRVLRSLEAHPLQGEFPLQTVTTGMARESFASMLCLSPRPVCLHFKSNTITATQEYGT